MILPALADMSNRGEQRAISQSFRCILLNGAPSSGSPKVIDTSEAFWYTGVKSEHRYADSIVAPSKFEMLVRACLGSNPLLYNQRHRETDLLCVDGIGAFPWRGSPGWVVVPSERWQTLADPCRKPQFGAGRSVVHWSQVLDLSVRDWAQTEWRDLYITCIKVCGRCPLQKEGKGNGMNLSKNLRIGLVLATGGCSRWL